MWRNPIVVDIIFLGRARFQLRILFFTGTSDTFLTHRIQELLTDDEEQKYSSTQKYVQEERFTIQTLFNFDDIYGFIVYFFVELSAELEDDPHYKIISDNRKDYEENYRILTSSL